MKTYELQAFELWIEDGNAMVIDGAWSTQDAQWCNRIETKPELWKYFLREFFETTPDKYMFDKVKPYMVMTSEGEWELKFKYASEWIVELFKITRNAIHGRFCQSEEFEGDDYSFRIDKPVKTSWYGKLYVTDKN